MLLFIFKTEGRWRENASDLRNTLTEANCKILSPTRYSRSSEELGTNKLWHLPLSVLRPCIIPTNIIWCLKAT